MDFNDDKHLDVCQNIEFGLKREYERSQHLTDSLCILALENAKVAAKRQFGYAKNEPVSGASEIQGIIEWCVAIAVERIGKVNDLTLTEFIACLEKIKRQRLGQVPRHVPPTANVDIGPALTIIRARTEI